MIKNQKNFKAWHRFIHFEYFIIQQSPSFNTTPSAMNKWHGLSSGGQFSSILLFWSASKNWHDKGWPFVGNAIFDGDYLKWSWKEGWPLVWETLFERDYLNWSMKLFIYSLLSTVSSTIIILIDFQTSYRDWFLIFILNFTWELSIC